MDLLNFSKPKCTFCINTCKVNTFPTLSAWRIKPYILGYGSSRSSLKTGSMAWVRCGPQLIHTPFLPPAIDALLQPGLTSKHPSTPLAGGLVDPQVTFSLSFHVVSRSTSAAFSESVEASKSAWAHARPPCYASYPSPPASTTPIHPHPTPCQAPSAPPHAGYTYCKQQAVKRAQVCVPPSVTYGAAI